MKEQGQRPELSEQFQLDLAYFNFIRLASYFGKSPKIEDDEPENIKNMKKNMRTLSVNVPSFSDSELPFFISGIDFGEGSNYIELRYEIEDRAVQMSLIKGKNSGNVHVKQATLFNYDEQSRVTTPALYKNFKPDFNQVCELLGRAAIELERQEKERYRAKFDKQKLTIRQRLSGKMQDVLR